MNTSPPTREAVPGLDRHLLDFDPRKVPQYRFDVLVIGGGAAGGASALAAARAGASVALLTKSAAGESNTLYAQGGMAAVVSPEDSFEAHVEDTLRVGCGLAERAVVEHVVRGGPRAVEALLEWGAHFDRLEDGRLDLTREGGHSHKRVVHARGDATGQEIQGAIGSAIAAEPAVTVFENSFAVDLLTQGGADASGGPERVVGALVWTARSEPVAFLARQVILATGGAGQVFRETTNPVIATGDGVALGFRAGAALQDLEFFQFHPTCLYIAGAARVLISEIVRGAGGVLRDRDGQRFMPEYHPDAELAPRDVVSRAVFERMVATGDTSVYLDLSGLDRNPHELFPGISRICRFFGIDIARDPVPVRPGAHYMIGGLAVDTSGRTSVPGLWAAGECSSTGLHGANRVGSNSLLEALVLGTDAGTAAAEAARRGRGGELELPGHPVQSLLRPEGVRVNIEDVIYSLKSLMWRAMGVQRTGEALVDAQEKIDLWSRAVRGLARPEPRTWELLNMLALARLASIGALAREESRGVHWRADFPETAPAWRAHTRLRPVIDAGRVAAVELSRAPVRGAEADRPRDVAASSL